MNVRSDVRASLPTSKQRAHTPPRRAGWVLAPAAARSASSRLMQRRTNALDDDRETAGDELVGKSKNTKPCTPEPCIPLGILDLCIRRLVRAPVRFDDDFSRKTNEIREIRSNWGLSTKAVAVDLMISQHAP